jgi:hypothetical protein
MLRGITSQQMTEMEAYSRVEADPEGEEARVARIALEQKRRFKGIHGKEL